MFQYVVILTNGTKSFAVIVPSNQYLKAYDAAADVAFNKYPEYRNDYYVQGFAQLAGSSVS